MASENRKEIKLNSLNKNRQFFFSLRADEEETKQLFGGKQMSQNAKINTVGSSQIKMFFFPFGEKDVLGKKGHQK